MLKLESNEENYFLQYRVHTIQYNTIHSLRQNLFDGKHHSTDP